MSPPPHPPPSLPGIRLVPWPLGLPSPSWGGICGPSPVPSSRGMTVQCGRDQRLGWPLPPLDSPIGCLCGGGAAPLFPAHPPACLPAWSALPPRGSSASLLPPLLLLLICSQVPAWVAPALLREAPALPSALPGPGFT